LGTALDVYGNIKLNDGILDLAGKNLTLRSNATNTATIDKLNAGGTNLLNAGNVTAERWIPLRQNIANGGRAYRVLGSIVSTTTSINANWQNNETNTAIGTNINNNNPLYGTQITGTGGSANGFDVTQTNASSLYTFTPGSSIAATLAYPAVTNTNINTFDGKTGYFLYLRGDRSMSMQIPYNPAGGMPTSSTTLRATGAVQKGPVSFTISGTVGDFSLITNPYPAPLDWQAVSDATPGIATSYYMWDANMGIRGAFVTVLYSGSNGSGSAAGRYIQPGEAFFVQSNGASTVNMTEAMKAVGNNDNGIFRHTTSFESFSVDLYLTEANNVRHTADGILVRYDNSYSRGIDTDDADEINNWNENIAVSRAGSHLSLESRPVIMSRDTILLFMNNMRQTGYELVFTPSKFTNTGLKAELVDRFLNTRTLLSVTDSSVVPFAITNDPASADSNRFMLVFGPFNPLATEVLTIRAQAENRQGQDGVRVYWTAGTETNMDRYEVERSTDGVQFNKLNTTAAIGNSNVPVNYNWLDASPQPGINFYRVKAIDRSPAVKYSAVVKVNTGNAAGGISIYPNPVTAKIVNIAFAKMEKGIYRLRLINGLGQVVLVQQLVHAGGNVVAPVKLTDVAAGIYQLEITKPNNSKIVKGLIVTD
ncbi:MAG: T9SS type A sorting domain-containing protein, partial [Ferruginibacter sp.]